MAVEMYLWITEMDYMLFVGVPELLNTEYLPPILKFDQADGEFVCELHLTV
jgi:hypothetical protein